MSTKRKHQESDPRSDVHASRQLQVYGSNPKPAKKPRRFEPPNYRKQAHASSVNAIKKRIRDVTRKLERGESMPADLKLESERALAAFQQELAAAEAEKTRQKMIKKYHMVRFFERQKATRQLKKIRKRLLAAESTEEVETLKFQMHGAEVDLSYTQYHPLSETYISLYPPSNDSEDGDGPRPTVSKAKPPIWSEVETCMEEGTLNKLRNRTSTTPLTTTKVVEKKPLKKTAKLPPPDTTGMNRRQRRAQREQPETHVRAKGKSMAFDKNRAFGASQSAEKAAREVDLDMESDGGFFE